MQTTSQINHSHQQPDLFSFSLNRLLSYSYLLPIVTADEYFLQVMNEESLKYIKMQPFFLAFCIISTLIWSWAYS